MTHRMQIVVDVQTRQDLLWLATQEDKSASRLIRDLVAKEAELKKRNPKKNDAVEVLLKAAKRADKKGPSSGPADFAKRHDEYLY